MRAIYTTLAVIVALVVIAHLLLGQETGFIRDFAPGLATEVLGILLTLVFVHRILDRRAMEERARASRGGVRRAEDPLRDLSDLWTEIVRGCLERLPSHPPHTYEELFSSEWSAAIDHCDLTHVRYAWSDETWAESAARVIARARDQISGILDLYGVHLNAHFIEVLDEIRDDPFLSHVETLGEQLRVGGSSSPTRSRPRTTPSHARLPCEVDSSGRSCRPFGSTTRAPWATPRSRSCPRTSGIRSVRQGRGR